MGDDIKQWEIYDGYNIGYKNGKYYVDNNGELVELGGGSFQEAANIASILGIQPTEPMGGGGGFTEKSDWERQAGHLKENRAYSKAIRQQRRLQRKNKKFNLNNIMGKFPIFKNGGIVRFLPGGAMSGYDRYLKDIGVPAGYSYLIIPDETEGNGKELMQVVSPDKQDTMIISRWAYGPKDKKQNRHGYSNRDLSSEWVRDNLGLTEINSNRNAFDWAKDNWNLNYQKYLEGLKKKKQRATGVVVPFSTPSVMKK